MDIKLIRSKNLVALVICFCISIISFNIQNIYFRISYLNKDFYNSNELESALYEIATNSVYTVVGDNASEKMLDYRNESRKIISNYTCAQIFVINNNSKEIYSNNIFELDKYMKSVEGYAEIYEINFKQNVMYKLSDEEKVRVSTNEFGNLAQTRKEDVTTYIAIPTTYDISAYKNTNDSEPLYVKYIQFTRNVRDANIFIGSKIIAGIIVVAYLVLYILKNKEQNKKIMFNNILKTILLIVLALILSILQSKVYGWSILYPIINTALLYIVYYSSTILLGDKGEEEVFSETLISKKLYELKRRNTTIYTIAKYIWIFIALLIMQIVATFTYDSNYIVYEFMIYIIPPLCIALCIVSILIIIDKVKKIEKIRTGISEIKNGNIEYKIEIKKDSLFNDIVCDINEMGETINIAVEERLKSEKMKNELITNVSHDLKTPLTAMINYISLMKKEDIQPGHIKDYVQVLDKRSQRL